MPEWKPEDEKELIRLYNLGLPLGQIARQLKRSYDALWSKLKNFHSSGEVAYRVPHPHTQCFDKYLKLSGNIMITSDWHIPYYDTALAEKMLYIAQKFDIKKMICAGDFIDAYAISAFSIKIKEDTFQKELLIANDVMQKLLEVFDWIFLLKGNHELRFLHALSDQVGMEHLKTLITQDKRVFASDYSYAVVDGQWRITHPISYSQIRSRVANRLALKFHQNIIMCHGHLWNMGIDDSGIYQIVDIGGMMDPDKIEYLGLRDTTHPRWNRGFAMLLDGYLYTFNNLITNWRFWECLKL